MSRPRRSPVELPKDAGENCLVCSKYSRVYFCDVGKRWCGFFKKVVDNRGSCATMGDYQEGDK